MADENTTGGALGGGGAEVGAGGADSVPGGAGGAAVPADAGDIAGGAGGATNVDGAGAMAAGAPDTAWAVPDGVIRLKGAGQEKEFKTLEELKKAAQYGLGAQKAFEEAAALRKAQEEWTQERDRIAGQLSAFVERGKKSAKDVLLEFGHDPLKFAEEVLDGHLKAQAMTPEQRAERERLLTLEREAEELRTWKAETEAKEQKRMAAEEQAKKAEEAKASRAEMEALIAKELEADPFLNVQEIIPQIQWKTAFYITAAKNQGAYLPLDKALALVRRDMQELSKRHLGALPPEEVVKVMGEEWLTKIRSHDIARAKAPAKEKPAAGEGRPAKFNTFEDFLRDKRGIKK